MSRVRSRKDAVLRRHDILVVEDERATSEAILRVLDLAGYSARTAVNGIDALAQVQQRRPDLVLLDIVMPVMDGWQCARELRASYGQSLPIVVVTAVEEARPAARQAGVDDVLVKPFEMQDLLDMVSRYAECAGGSTMRSSR